MLSSFFFFIDRRCRLLSIFRPGQDAKLIVFFSKINKKEYEAVFKPPPQNGPGYPVGT